MDTRFLKKKAELEASDEVYIFNPDEDSFTWNYNGVPYTIESKQMVKLPKVIAKHIAEHLCDKLGGNREEMMKLVLS